MMYQKRDNMTFSEKKKNRGEILVTETGLVQHPGISLDTHGDGGPGYLSLSQRKDMLKVAYTPHRIATVFLLA